MSVVQRLTGNLPAEWAAIPHQILEALIPLQTQSLAVPGGEVRIVNFRGILTNAQKRRVDEILASRWFLIKNGGVLPPARCTRCGSTSHPYLTLGCIEKPYNGLGEIVALVEQQTQRGVARIVKAGRQATEKPLYDTTLDAVEIGAIVPITPEKAKALIDRINAKGYRWRGPVPDLSRAA
jgi:hypothetical protein